MFFGEKYIKDVPLHEPSREMSFYKDHFGVFWIFHALPDNRTKHSVPISSFHRVTGRGRGHQQVAYLNRPIFCRNFTGYDPHDGQRNFVAWC
jgi:hypothetical protein